MSGLQDGRRVRTARFAGAFAGLTPRSPDSLANVLLLLFLSFKLFIVVQVNRLTLTQTTIIVKKSGPEGIRTPGLLNAIEARSQLRYRPILWVLAINF